MKTAFQRFLQMNTTGWTALGYTGILLIAAGIIFKITPNAAAKKWDLDWSYLHMVITAVVLLIGAAITLPDIIKRSKERLPSSKGLLFLAVIVLFFGVFTYTQIERQHRVLSDETSWESMAIQMHYNYSGGTCNQGYYENESLVCTDEVNNFKGKASGFANKIAFTLLGKATRDEALQVNFVFYIFSIIFLFYGFFLAFKNENTALASTLFFASFPTMMFQSQTATTEVMYVFLFSVLFVVVQLFQSDDEEQGTFKLSLKHLILIIPLLGFFAQTRQETIFSFIPFVFYYHRFFKEKAWYLPLFTFFVMLASFPVINTICAYKGYGFQGGEYDAHSFWNLTMNFWTNIDVMLNWGTDYAGLLRRPYNTTVSILLFLGTIYLTMHVLFNKKYRWGFFLVLVYQLQAIVIMVNVSGNFTIDINQRYILVAFPTFALILGLFLHDVTTRIGALKQLPSTPKIFGAINALWIGAYLVFTYKSNSFFTIQSETFFGSAAIVIGKTAVAALVFAVVGYLGYFLFKKYSQWSKATPLMALPIAVLALTLFLTFYHKESFNKNIQYRRNKLLTEEALLNVELKKLPSNSIFIYSRPWQMIAQGLNAFSESKLLRWSDTEYAKWKDFSNNNIYLVRGQDGFGKVNKKSRVVGFKTTTKVDKILNSYHTKETFKNSKDFGYPLSITKLDYRKDKNKFQSQLYVKQEKAVNDSIYFSINKQFEETVSVKGTISSDLRREKSAPFTLSVSDKKQHIGIPFHSAGMNAIHFDITLPDTTVYTHTEYIFNEKGATLLSGIPPWKTSQSWGSLRINKSVENNELTIDGKRFTQGFGTHGYGTISFKTNGNYRRLYTSFGMDDEAMCGDGILMKVYGDDQLLYQSDTLHAQTLGTAQQNNTPGIDISAIQTLKLVADTLGSNACDHANWVNPWME